MPAFARLNATLSWGRCSCTAAPWTIFVLQSVLALKDGKGGGARGSRERDHTCFDSFDFSDLVPLLKRPNSFFLTSLMAQFPKFSV